MTSSFASFCYSENLYDKLYKQIWRLIPCTQLFGAYSLGLFIAHIRRHRPIISRTVLFVLYSLTLPGHCPVDKLKNEIYLNPKTLFCTLFTLFSVLKSSKEPESCYLNNIFQRPPEMNDRYSRIKVWLVTKNKRTDKCHWVKGMRGGLQRKECKSPKELQVSESKRKGLTSVLEWKEWWVI